MYDNGVLTVDVNNNIKLIINFIQHYQIIKQLICLYLSVEVDDINFTPEQVINIIPSSS